MTSFVNRAADLRANANPAGLVELLPYAGWLGVHIDICGNDLQFSLPARKALVGNPVLPALHGGVIAGFMELSAMLSIVWREAPERLPMNINFALDYLRSAELLDTHARCTINKLGSRVAQVQVECWQDDPGRPVAVGRAHLLWDYPSDPSQTSSLS